MTYPSLLRYAGLLGSRHVHNDPAFRHLSKTSFNFESTYQFQWSTYSNIQKNMTNECYIVQRLVDTCVDMLGAEESPMGSHPTRKDDPV